jgi:bacteriocin-like protein
MAEEEQVVEEREINDEELETVSGGDEGPPAPPVSGDGR